MEAILDVERVSRSKYQFQAACALACSFVLVVPCAVNAQPVQKSEASEPNIVAVGVRGLSLVGNPPALGAAQAPVTIVEFADFECSFCRQMSEVLERQLMPAEKDTVRIVYRYLPLPQHPWARPAAEMAACVELQDNTAFWKLHDFLYANQDRFSAASLRQEGTQFLSTQPRIKMESFTDCVERGMTKETVEKDKQMGRSAASPPTAT